MSTAILHNAKNQTDTSFDRIFISVGDDEKKALYLRLLDAFASLPAKVRILPDDPHGARIGSAGAVAQALSVMMREDGWQQKKYLLINDGGFSKRAVNFSVRGKLFCALDKDGDDPVTMFELLVQQTERLARRMAPGLVVCCSDVSADFLQTSVPVCRSTVFGAPAALSVATRHGVLFAEADGRLETYLHKPSLDKLREVCARYGMTDTAVVDTGAFFLTARDAAALDSFFHVFYRRQHPAVNFYNDILPQIVHAGAAAEPSSFAPFDSAERASMRQALSAVRLSAEILQEPFRHYGTIAELLAHFDALPAEKRRIRCLADAESTVGPGSVLHNVILKDGCTVGDRCLVTDVVLEHVVVPDDTSVFGVRLHDGRCVAVVSGVHEDWKTARGAQKPEEIRRFFAASTFTASYRSFTDGAAADGCDAVSLADCLRDADACYYADLPAYIRDKAVQVYREDAAYRAYREKVLTQFFQSAGTIERLQAVRAQCAVSLPVRINLAGTWTDAMPYCIDCGGSVIHAAVRLNGRLPLCVRIERTDARCLEFFDGGKLCYRFWPHASDCEIREDAFDCASLFLAALRVFGVTSRTELDCGLRLYTDVHAIRQGSGLGVSSILLAGCLKALHEIAGLPCTQTDLMRMVFAAEQLMFTGGGWQDQAGALYPGLKRTSAAPGWEQSPIVQPLVAGPRIAALLNAHAYLVYSGKRVFGRFIVRDIMDRYLSRERDTTDAFNTLRTLCDTMAQCIRADDADRFAECLNAQMDAEARLSPAVMNETITELRRFLQPYARASCIMGAGGGGYLLVIARENVPFEKLADALASHGHITQPSELMRVTLDNK